MFFILGIRRKTFCHRTIETVKLWKHPQPPTCTPASPKNKKKRELREAKRKKQYRYGKIQQKQK